MKISYSFLILLIFSLYIGYINYLILFMLCLLIHEIGHLLFIKIFDVNILGFNLTIYGCNLKLDQKKYNSLKKIYKFLIYFGGILFNLITILVLKNIIDFTNKNLLINMNMLLLIFNLLPVYPLDGYNILFLIINNKNIINNLTIFTIVILLIVSIYSNSLGLVIITLILLYKNIIYYKNKDKQYLLNLFKNMV